MQSTLSQLEPAYLQILSLGVIWTILHCGPMCGPIVGALQLTEHAQGRRLSALFYYQIGRGIMYALFGGLAGYFASSAELQFKNVGWFITGVLALMAVFKLSPFSLMTFSPSGPFLSVARVFQALPYRLRLLAFGGLLSFLPCMLTFWALNLAATTQSFFKGAVTMLLLILITSIPLGASIFLGSLASKLKIFRIEGWLLLLSAIWCFLMTAAATDWISHFYYDFEIGDKVYTIMFW